MELSLAEIKEGAMVFVEEIERKQYTTTSYSGMAERGVHIKAGTYKLVRWFDNDRVVIRPLRGTWCAVVPAEKVDFGEQ